jgi:hypothetical protein
VATDLRKGIALGNAGLNPTSIQNYSIQKGYLADTRTKWVRFWADWSELQPNPSSAFDHPKWGDLDAQIRQAIADGYYVMVTAYRCPAWANSNRRAYLASKEIVLSAEQQKFVVPDGVFPFYGQARSPWSLFIEHLTIRYNPGNPGNGGAWVHCVEVLNEPNVQMMPQWDPERPLAERKPAMPALAARMMQTAQYVKNGINGAKDYWPILVGPATGDTEKDDLTRMPYDVFTRELITELQGIGFAEPGGWFAWSHHNHRDIELNAGGPPPPNGLPPQINRAQRARSLIQGKWKGWGAPTDANNPRIFLTEGGARLDVIKAEWYASGGGDVNAVRTKQAQLLQDQITRMTTGSEGVGMSMMMHYLVTSTITYDTGLRDAYTYESEASII